MLKAVDQFLVYDPEDRFLSSLCYGEVETRKIVSDFGCTAGLVVLRITEGELCRDVTADFLPEDEPAAEQEDYSFRSQFVTSTSGSIYPRER
jgi:hypothetical protein